MYTKEQLLKYSYFEDILKVRDITSVVDSLTGLVSRRYIIGLIQSLIDNNVPFSLALLDLDNFKFINDTYGHKIGDGVLSGMSKDLIRYLGEYGIAGRYGGDEFLIINFRDRTYDDLKSFYMGLYSNYNVLRKNINLDTCEPFITGTIGSAVYPTDASEYETLFNLVDKALYRGKTKGRNCYIIYVEEKHKGIKIKDLAGRGIYTIFRDLSSKFDSEPVLSLKLKSMLDVLDDDMRISDLYYVGRDNIMKSISSNEIIGKVNELELLTSDGIFTTNEIKDIKFKSRSMFELCRDKEFETVLVTQIGLQDEIFGYLVCAEPRNLRIWQDDEFAIMYFVSRMIAGYISMTGDAL